MLKFHSASIKRIVVDEKHEKDPFFLASLPATVVFIAPFYIKALEVSGQTIFLYAIFDEKIKINISEDLDEINEMKLL